MTNQTFADELEKEIKLMYHELRLKRRLLNESREKLTNEILLHKDTKSNEIQYFNENKELKIQLEMSTKATKKLEEENDKSRELLVKLQVQLDTYLSERQILTEKCYQISIENMSLKNEILELKEKLEGHVSFQENYKIRQSESSRLLDKLTRKQEKLNKEQNRLMAVCKEGLQFANKVSEEAKFQARYVLEATASQRKMEEKMIYLLAVIADLQESKRKESSDDFQEKEQNYIAEYKSQQEEMKSKIEELMEENKRLTDELNAATTQIDLLVKQII